MSTADEGLHWVRARRKRKVAEVGGVKANAEGSGGIRKLDAAWESRLAGGQA